MPLTPEELTEKSRQAQSGRGWNESVPQCPKCGIWLHGVAGMVCREFACPTDVAKYGIKYESDVGGSNATNT